MLNINNKDMLLITIKTKEGGIYMMRKIRLDSKTFLAAYASALAGIVVILIILVWYFFFR